MTAPASPDLEVRVDAELTAEITSAPGCEVKVNGRPCSFPASWVGRVTNHPHPHADEPVLACNGHQSLLARHVARGEVRCLDCDRAVSIRWERL